MEQNIAQRKKKNTETKLKFYSGDLVTALM